MAGLRDELAALYEQHHALTPRIVVDAARARNHPLHAMFEWNDKVAGEKYRLVQAREYIRSVNVEFTTRDGDPEEVRQYLSVRDESGYAYRRTEEVAEDPIVAEIVLRDAEREWQTLRKRYAHLQAFVELVRADLEAIAV